MALKKLFGSRPKDPTAELADLDLRGGDILEKYERLVRQGGSPPALVINRVGDIFRDLRRFDEAARKYLLAADRYVRDESWTHAQEMLRKADRLIAEHDLGSGDLPTTRTLLRRRIALGRGESGEAVAAIDEAAGLLAPSDGETIERLITYVDAEPGTGAEVEVALAEALLALARPERAVERLRLGLAQARRDGHKKRISDIETRLAAASMAEAAARQGPVAKRLLAGRSGAEPAADGAPEEKSTPTDSLTDEAAQGGTEIELLSPEMLVAYDEPAQSVEIDPLPVPEPTPSDADAPVVESFDLPPLDIEWPGPEQANEPETEALPALVTAAPEHVVPVPRATEPAAPEAPADPEPSEAHAAVGQESAPVAARTQPTHDESDYIDLTELRRGDATGPASTRVVGSDARNVTADEAEQIGELVRQLREGIAVSVPEEDAETHYHLGLSFLQMRMFDEAVESFQVAFRAPAFRFRAVEALAEALIERGDPLIAHRAVRTAREALAHGADEIGFLYWQGRAAEALGRSEEAQDFYERVCVEDVRFMDARDRLAALAGAER